MRTMQCGKVTTYSFWGNVEYPSNKDAMKARNAMRKEFKAKGYLTDVHSLAGQMRKYAGLGQPDGTIGTVYYLRTQPKE